jgi:non-homologous end joining protein Ku
MLVMPLSVFTGTEETRVARSEFYRGDANIPLGRAVIRKDTGDVVHPTDVTRMAQASNGAWVTFTDDEIAACTSPRGLAEIVCFVKAKDFGKYLVEGVKQVRPKREKGKINGAVEKAFVLLTTVMRERKLYALVKVAMRGPARYALLDADGNLFLVYTADAVRQPTTAPASVAIFDAERNVANMLVDAIGIDAPTLVDTNAPVAQAYVDQKAQGVEAPAPVEHNIDPSADLMASLLASLSAQQGEVAS